MSADETTRPSRLPLCALAPAKINLGLFVGPVRADGRHELVSVMQSISLADELTLSAAEDGAAATSHDVIECAGVPGPSVENLAARALDAFRAATGWAAPRLRLCIDKHVPVAAGLGGGSGDAAAALRLAAAASGLGDEALLSKLARGLGADVPAQIRPGRWLASGAGESLQALPVPRASFGVLVLPAAAGLSTAAVYECADALATVRGRDELEERRAALARALAEGAALPAVELLENDLQDAARALRPEIDIALSQARAAGAEVALLSGSGPTVLGLFAGPDGLSRARQAAHALAAERSAAGAPAALAAEPIAESFAAVVRGERPRAR